MEKDVNNPVEEEPTVEELEAIQSEQIFAVADILQLMKEGRLPRYED